MSILETSIGSSVTAMLATLIGVFIAIDLGILDLIVGIFQAWVAYEVWKYPKIGKEG